MTAQQCIRARRKAMNDHRYGRKAPELKGLDKSNKPKAQAKKVKK